MSEYQTPQWLQQGDLTRVRKSDIPTVWNHETMNKFIMEDDVALLRGAKVISQIFNASLEVDDPLVQLRAAMAGNIPASIIQFVSDINTKWISKRRISVAQLKGLRNVFKKNNGFIDYLVIKANEVKSGN